MKVTRCLNILKLQVLEEDMYMMPKPFFEFCVIRRIRLPLHSWEFNTIFQGLQIMMIFLWRMCHLKYLSFQTCWKEVPHSIGQRQGSKALGLWRRNCKKLLGSKICLAERSLLGLRIVPSIHDSSELYDQRTLHYRDDEIRHGFESYGPHLCYANCNCKVAYEGSICYRATSVRMIAVAQPLPYLQTADG